MNCWIYLPILYFFLFIHTPTPLSGQQPIDVNNYLNFHIDKQAPSRLLLIETFEVNRSKDADYKKKYLSSREEFDFLGRSSLNIYYDYNGKMTSKVIMFYPSQLEEKGVIQPRQGFIDSVKYEYNEHRNRTSEIWYWGETASSDTLLYSYNQNKQLSKIVRKYGWDTKWDTLIYSKNNRIDKAVFYSERTGMQKEVQFVFIFDSLLVKTNTLNRDRLITEEQFFFYNNKGQTNKTITKYYPEGNEIIDPPRMVEKRTYYSNGKLKKSKQTYYSRAQKKVSFVIERYDRNGYLTSRFERNLREKLYKKTIIQYTIKKNRKVVKLPDLDNF